MMWDVLSFYVAANRTKLLIIAAISITVIAIIDWVAKLYISLGFLYLFPIMIVGGYLSRKEIIAVALLCAFLQEAFSDLPGNEALVRMIFSSAGFIGTGLFISEVLRNRRIVLKHIEELKNEVKLRQDAEEQLRFLVESSPAAIITIESNGKILLANEAAQRLLAPQAPPLRGQTISAYLPSLQTIVQTHPSRIFRTALQCRGQRSDGEAFLAGIWFSTYATISGPRLAAVVVDLSEDLRNREDLSLDYLLKNSRILMSAVAHEVRNLCGAVLVVQKNLSRLRELQDNEDFQALSTLIQSLEKISALELEPAAPERSGAVELTSVLDEVRVLIDSTCHESKIEVEWHIQDFLPLVRADRYGLLQVFLNLTRNSQRAMMASEIKRLSVSTSREPSSVVIRFEDTGTGISSPENLFRPFQRGSDSSGLGLYVSRAIMRGFGGDLLYEPKLRGCCFAIVLPSLSNGEEAIDAGISEAAD
jgi:two-component system, LuxR family, sensor kinase FixL